MLPAFMTASSIPRSQINLRHGRVQKENGENCLAGAGTFTLEMTLLSDLTGYTIYQEVAMRSMKALCSLVSPNGLIPGMLNVDSQRVRGTTAHIGAGSDSFYEYLYKTSQITGDKEISECFTKVGALCRRVVIRRRVLSCLCQDISSGGGQHAPSWLLLPCVGEGRIALLVHYR